MIEKCLDVTCLHVYEGKKRVIFNVLDMRGVKFAIPKNKGKKLQYIVMQKEISTYTKRTSLFDMHFYSK